MKPPFTEGQRIEIHDVVGNPNNGQTGTVVRYEEPLVKVVWDDVHLLGNYVLPGAIRALEEVKSGSDR